MRSMRPRSARPAASRRALLLGSAALPLASCGLIGGPDTSDGADGGGPDPAASDGGASDGGADRPIPRLTTDDWAVPAELESTPPDLAAADQRYGLGPGTVERSDGFGDWVSPGFPEDGEILAPEVRIDDVEGFTPEQAQTVGRVLLVTCIQTILDSPLALAEDNGRAVEVSPELLESFGLSDVDPHAFDDVFTQQIPLTGTGDPERSALDRYGIEPQPYTAGQPRIHLLDHGVRIRPPQFDWEGPSIHASARGVIPVVTEAGEDLLVREASLMLNIGEGKDEGLVVIACGLGAGVATWLQDPTVLPEITADAEVPEDWIEHTLGTFTARLPLEGGEPTIHDLGLSVVGADGRPSASLSEFVLPLAAPFPVTRSEAAARFPVDGADLVVAMISEEDDGTATVLVRVHHDGLGHRIQLFGRHPEEAPFLAHQVVAGLAIG